MQHVVVLFNDFECTSDFECDFDIDLEFDFDTNFDAYFECDSV